MAPSYHQGGSEPPKDAKLLEHLYNLGTTAGILRHLLVASNSSYSLSDVSITVIVYCLGSNGKKNSARIQYRCSLIITKSPRLAESAEALGDS